MVSHLNGKQKSRFTHPTRLTHFPQVNTLLYFKKKIILLVDVRFYIFVEPF